MEIDEYKYIYIYMCVCAIITNFFTAKIHIYLILKIWQGIGIQWLFKENKYYFEIERQLLYSCKTPYLDRANVIKTNLFSVILD